MIRFEPCDRLATTAKLLAQGGELDLQLLAGADCLRKLPYVHVKNSP